MSCYFRHVKDIFAEAGIRVGPGNKKLLDQAFHRIVGTTYKDCPATWRALKANYLVDEKRRAELVKQLKAAVG
jgi:hypothetical protein